MIDERIKGLKDPSISPPPPNASPEKWADCHFRRIEVKGKFLNSQTFYVGPRSSPALHASGTGLMSASNPQTGYFMITPFVPTNGADFDPLLVNRGWIPTSLKKQMQEVSDSAEQYCITCVPRPGERQSMFITNDAANGNWLSMNVAEMARHTGMERTAPVICDLLGPRAPLHAALHSSVLTPRQKWQASSRRRTRSRSGRSTSSRSTSCPSPISSTLPRGTPSPPPLPSGPTSASADATRAIAMAMAIARHLRSNPRLLAPAAGSCPLRSGGCRALRSAGCVRRAPAGPVLGVGPSETRVSRAR
jgi:cytochrome oxidase assembly protein ShyY1